jgi:hypothetical protein
MKTFIFLLSFIASCLCEAQPLIIQGAGSGKSPHTSNSQIDLGVGPNGTTNTFNRIDGVATTKYYLSSNICQNPLSPDIIIQVSSEWPNGHNWSDGNKFIYQRSTDRGNTWSAKADFFSPGASIGAIDGGGGYSSDGRYHQFIDAHAGSGEGGSSQAPHYLYHCYSDDNGTTVTSSDITSVIPSDGLATWRAYGNLVEAGGYLFFPYYKVTNELNFTNSARYILKKPLSGGSWASILVSTGTDFIGEGSIISLGGNYLLYVSRNEVTKEFTSYISSDLGETWGAGGTLSLGETLSGAGPPRLASFEISGVLVIVIYYADRVNTRLKACYGKASVIIASGAVTGFDLTTKTTLHDNGTQEEFHYGQVLHHYNNFNALGSYAREAGAADYAVKNYLDIFRCPSSHYQTVKTALGL